MECCHSKYPNAEIQGFKTTIRKCESNKGTIPCIGSKKPPNYFNDFFSMYHINIQAGRNRNSRRIVNSEK